MKPIQALSFSLFLLSSVEATAHHYPADSRAKAKSLSIIFNPTPHELARRAQKRDVPWWNKFVSPSTLKDAQKFVQPYPITSSPSFSNLMLKRWAKMALWMKIKKVMVGIMTVSVFDSHAFAIVSVLIDLLEVLLFYKLECDTWTSGFIPFACMLYLHAHACVMHAVCWQTSCSKGGEPLVFIFLTLFECVFAWIIHEFLKKHLQPTKS